MPNHVKADIFVPHMPSVPKHTGTHTHTHTNAIN